MRAIKAQALAEYIAKIPQDDESTFEPEDPIWSFHIDDVSRSEKQGDDILLKGPNGRKMMKSIKFGFLTVTNNIFGEINQAGIILRGLKSLKLKVTPAKGLERCQVLCSIS